MTRGSKKHLKRLNTPKHWMLDKLGGAFRVWVSGTKRACWYREKHEGNFDIIHVKDLAGHEFATRMSNVFTIGQGTKPSITLLPSKGIRLSIIEEARRRRAGAKIST